MEKIKLNKVVLRRFGFTMAACFVLILGIFFMRRGRFSLPVFGIAGTFLILALILPGVLKPLYLAWMKFALILGWINTRIILLAVFYLVFTPVSLVLRIMRKDLLDLRIDKERKSYWINKDNKEFNMGGYERLF